MLLVKVDWLRPSASFGSFWLCGVLRLSKSPLSRGAVFAEAKTDNSFLYAAAGVPMLVFPSSGLRGGLQHF